MKKKIIIAVAAVVVVLGIVFAVLCCAPSEDIKSGNYVISTDESTVSKPIADVLVIDVNNISSKDGSFNGNLEKVKFSTQYPLNAISSEDVIVYNVTTNGDDYKIFYHVEGDAAFLSCWTGEDYNTLVGYYYLAE